MVLVRLPLPRVACFLSAPRKVARSLRSIPHKLKSGVRLLSLNRLNSDVFCTPLPVGELLCCHIRVGDSISV